MTSIDEFRSSINESDDDAEQYTSDFGVEIVEERRAQRRPRKFLGMTAGERAFLAVMVFVVTLVACLALLLYTGRVVF